MPSAAWLASVPLRPPFLRRAPKPPAIYSVVYPPPNRPRRDASAANSPLPNGSPNSLQSERSFGDLEGGRSVGEQTNTGYDVRGTNLRLARKLDADARLTFGLQRVFMDDVPRTHKTLDALTWKGLSQGSELWRLLDQERRLYYGRLSWENAGGLADAGSVTLSLHQHGQERNRMKTTGGVANNGDFQSFDLDHLAFSARFETDDPWGGRLAYGAELHRETLTSSGHNFDANQAFTSLRDQGPLAADATYSRYAFYLADSLEVAPASLSNRACGSLGWT